MKQNNLTLCDLVNRAKGDRSIAQFAEDCGVSPATMYKIAQGNIKRKIAESTLDAIVAKADPDSDVTKVDFLAAEGLVLEQTAPFSAVQKSRQRVEAYEKKLSYMIPGVLMAEGYEVSTYTAKSSMQELPVDFGLIVRDHDNEELWLFDLLYVARDRMNIGLFMERFYSRIGRIACHLPPGKTVCRLYMMVIVDSDADRVDDWIDILRTEIEKMHTAIDVCVLPVDTDLNFLGEIVPSGITQKRKIFT